MTHSLSMHFDMIDGRHVVEASWGVFDGDSWLEAYSAALRARPRG